MKTELPGADEFFGYYQQGFEIVENLQGLRRSARENLQSSGEKAGSATATIVALAMSPVPVFDATSGPGPDGMAKEHALYTDEKFLEKLDDELAGYVVGFGAGYDRFKQLQAEAQQAFQGRRARFTAKGSRSSAIRIPHGPNSSEVVSSVKGEIRNLILDIHLQPRRTNMPRLLTVAKPRLFGRHDIYHIDPVNYVRFNGLNTQMGRAVEVEFLD